MLPSLLQKLRLQKSGPEASGTPAGFAAPAPGEPLCVIGDVHGCLDLLERMLAQVPQGHRIVLAGDYTGRGEQSAEVLRYLSAPAADLP